MKLFLDKVRIQAPRPIGTLQLDFWEIVNTVARLQIEQNPTFLQSFEAHSRFAYT